MSFAIIETGGKQYKVSASKILEIEKLNAKKGETIKAISTASRLSLEEFLGSKVHLFLRLKIREKWMEETERYSEMGLDFRDGNL